MQTLQEFLLLCTDGSIDKMFDYWAHASAIDIGESLTAPDNFQVRTEHFIIYMHCLCKRRDGVYAQR
jgi:hypothetical protein